jgi:hypothetical protein
VALISKLSDDLFNWIVVADIVVGSMLSLNVMNTFLFLATPVVPLAGLTDTTVGAEVSCACAAPLNPNVRAKTANTNGRKRLPNSEEVT